MMIDPLRRGQRVGEQRREPQRREDVGLVGGAQRLDRLIVVIGSIGGIPNALLIRQSTLPNSSSARSTSADPRRPRR